MHHDTEHSHGHKHSHDHKHDHDHDKTPKAKSCCGKHEHDEGCGGHGKKRAGHLHEYTHEGHHHSHHHAAGGSVLVLRPSTGISGDIMVTGLARMLDADQSHIDAHIVSIGLPELAGGLRVEAHSLNEVGGWISRVTLPHEHAHRTLADILGIIGKSDMTPGAKTLASSAFSILAEAEGAVHGKEVSTVSFHEVGALDSILDTCLAAALFAELAPARFVCGSLPLCDGAIRCAHGVLPSPAPAVLRLLRGVPVHGIASQGETVTPTGLALLKAFGAEFGSWPAMILEKETMAYGTKVFPNVPNGAIFAYGTLCRK